MASKATLKLSKDLLDRFFRDAEGRTNRQIDVYFVVQDMGLARDKVDEAMAFLTSRNLVNLFGTDIAFLTDKGVQAIAEDMNIAKLPKEFRNFKQVEPKAAALDPTADVPRQESAPPATRAPAPSKATADKATTPAEPHLVHMSVDTGTEAIVKLEWVCRVGRAEGNEIQIDDKRASKVHAEFRYENGAYILSDRDSANGTLLNGEYVVEDMKLKHDDEVVIGRTMLLYQAPTGVPEPTSPAPGSSLPEPATLMAAATERPADADQVRVVRGTPDAVVADPAAVDGLFDNEPAAAPQSDLFDSPDPQEISDTADLFTEGPNRDVKADDLFDPGSQAPSEDLFAPRKIPQAPSNRLTGDFEPEPSSSDSGSSDSGGPWSRDTPMPDRPAIDPSDLAEHSLEPATEFARDADLLANQPVVAPDEDSIIEGSSLEPFEDDEEPPDDEATMMVSRQAEADLPSWADAPAPSDSHPSFAAPREEEETATLTQTDAEDLPVATPSLSMAPVQAPSRVSDGPFMTTLRALKQHVERADLPDRPELVAAIEKISEHHYVRVALDLIED